MVYAYDNRSGGRLDHNNVKQRAIDSVDSFTLKMVKDNIYSLINNYESFKVNTGMLRLILSTIYGSTDTVTVTATNTTLKNFDIKPTFTKDQVDNFSTSTHKSMLNEMYTKFPFQKDNSANLAAKSVVLTGVNLYSSPLPAIGTSTKADGTPMQMDSNYVQNILLVCRKVYVNIYKQIYNFYKISSSQDTAYGAAFPDVGAGEALEAQLMQACIDLANYTPWTYLDTYDQFAANLYNTLFNPVVGGIDTPFKSSTDTGDALKRKLFFACFQPYFMMVYLRNLVADPDTSSANKAPLNFQVRRLAILGVYTINRYLLYTLYEVSALLNPASEEAITLRHLLDTQITTAFANEDTLSFQNRRFEEELELQNNMNVDIADQINRNNRDIELTRNKVENIAVMKQRLDSSYMYAQIYYWLWVALLIIYVIFAAAVLFFKKYKIFYIGSGIIYIFVFISILVYLFKKI